MADLAEDGLPEKRERLEDKLRRYAAIKDHGDYIPSEMLSAVMRAAADRIEYLELVAGAVSASNALDEWRKKKREEKKQGSGWPSRYASPDEWPTSGQK